MTTKFEVYAEKLEQARKAKRNAELNERLAMGLATRTREDVLEQMFEDLTFILGVGTVLTAAERATAASQGELLVF